MSEEYLLCIDESGKSKLSDDGNHFLLCGVVLKKELHDALSLLMVSFKQKHSISILENIHAFDLLEDEKHKEKRIPHSTITAFFEKLISLIEGSDIHCFIVCVDKKPYLEKIDRIARRKSVTVKTLTNYLKKNKVHDYLYEALARKIILEYGHYLHDSDWNGHVMAESRRQDDDAVLRAFMSATTSSKYPDNSNYKIWSHQAFKKIHTLTFQNKKGLSFGLEIADLFAWAYANKKFGKKREYKSSAKNRRIDVKIDRVNKVINGLILKKNIVEMTERMLKTVAGDRVSEATDLLNKYKINQ